MPPKAGPGNKRKADCIADGEVSNVDAIATVATSVAALGDLLKGTSEGVLQLATLAPVVLQLTNRLDKVEDTQTRSKLLLEFKK